MPFLRSQIPPLGVSSSYETESWEEQAFARDSAGDLGSCVWPPRSYSCSFCGREFRSAQALGGHMNVHRRDRAMLKHSPSLDSCAPTGAACPDQRALVNPNPNSSSISTRVPAAASRLEWKERDSISPSYSSSVVGENRKRSIFSAAPTSTESATLQLFSLPELNLHKRNSQRWKDEDDSDDHNRCSKRVRRTDSVHPFFVLPSSSGETQPLHPEVLKHDHGPVEELDLELRLGDSPQVKPLCLDEDR
ncbi:hypothetical protein MUK42_04205 [Musa troglodytarum]|uniref:C2H2-type domain-containing protein n=1 Tax=Musa troglodytarum TaxID=320322 RepID=A0A9E7GGN9_9LILI|nr:hypothetical protein MUK42_04205 [Musa troglodytarum]